MEGLPKDILSHIMASVPNDTHRSLLRAGVDVTQYMNRSYWVSRLEILLGVYIPEECLPSSPREAYNNISSREDHHLTSVVRFGYVELFKYLTSLMDRRGDIRPHDVSLAYVAASSLQLEMLEYLLTLPEVLPSWLMVESALKGKGPFPLIEVVKTIVSRMASHFRTKTVLNSAAKSGDVKVMEYLLSDSRVDSDDWDNMLFLGVKNPNMVRLLLQDRRIDPSNLGGDILVAALPHYESFMLLANDRRIDLEEHIEQIMEASPAADLRVIQYILDDPHLHGPDFVVAVMVEAAKHNKVALLELLLSYEDVDVTNYGFVTETQYLITYYGNLSDALRYILGHPLHGDVYKKALLRAAEENNDLEDTIRILSKA